MPVAPATPKQSFEATLVSRRCPRGLGCETGDAMPVAPATLKTEF